MKQPVERTVWGYQELIMTGSISVVCDGGRVRVKGCDKPICNDRGAF